jgi:filamentous hemagglutinin family protein
MAIATAALSPQQARAQAFTGTMPVTPGVTRTIDTPTSETITISNPTATIYWTANPTSPNVDTPAGTVDFMPSGTTAVFQGTAAAGTYTVLNRITPSSSAPISLNGTIKSYLDGGSQGGNIWFYTPSGIVVGAKAQFDVGGLLLTSISPTLNSSGATGFDASFTPVTGDGGTVAIQDGAKINALAAGSYVALIAPRIEQGGTVKVDG